MASFNYFQGLAEIDKRGDQTRCWMVSSASPLLELELARRLTDKVVTGPADFNICRIECGTQTTASAVMAAAEEFPMGSERRLVWLRGAQDLPDAQLLRLAAYVGEVPDSTVLLITAHGSGGGAEQPDEKQKGGGLRKLMEAVRSSGALVKATLEPADVATWLQREMEEAGLTSSAAVRRLITERAGDDLTALRLEVAKLRCYLGERTDVREQDVADIVTQTPASKIYHLSDALLSHDASKALTVLDELLQMEEPELRILAYLTTYYRGLIRLHALVERGESLPRICSLLDKPEWKVKKEVKLARQLTSHELQDAIELLLRADIGIKSGKDGRLLMELMILKLCRPSASRATVKTAR